MSPIEQMMRAAPVIPVLVIEDAGRAREIGEALVEGGLPVLEVTLRTPAAMAVLRAMADIDGAIVGAGTVLNADQLRAAQAAGARFAVSPGLTEPLARAAAQEGVPLLPGVATAGDIMRGLDLGLDRFKFFPAMAAGGLPALRSLSAPFGQVRFCPTGGITPDSAAEWLAEEAVLCVGGSWLVRPGMAPDAVAEAARRAAGLGTG